MRRTIYFLTTLLLSAQVTRADLYAITILNGSTERPNTSSVSAKSINDAGQILGVITAHSYGNRIVRWQSPDAPLTELGTLGTQPSGITYARARKMNSTGNGVGILRKYVEGTDLEYRAVRWNAGTTTPTELSSFTPDWRSEANSINDSGTVVGQAFDYGARTINAVLWSADSSKPMRLAIPPDASSHSSATAINSSGIIAGHFTRGVSDGEPSGQIPLRWDQGPAQPPTLLDTLPGRPGFNVAAIPADLNDAGIAVGYSQKWLGASTALRAVRWDAGSTRVTELDTLPGTHWSEATAVNQRGDIVGYCTFLDPGGQTSMLRAVLWPAGAEAVIDLNTLIDPEAGVTVLQVWDINSQGQIVGEAQYDPDGTGGIASSRVGIVLTPIPEPQAALGIVTSIVVLTSRRRRR